MEFGMADADPDFAVLRLVGVVADVPSVKSTVTSLFGANAESPP